MLYEIKHNFSTYTGRQNYQIHKRFKKECDFRQGFNRIKQEEDGKFTNINTLYIYRVFHGSENANYITSLMQQMMFIVFYFTIRLILRTLQTFIIIVTSWWLTWLMNSILIPSVIAKNFTGKVKKKKQCLIRDS